MDQNLANKLFLYEDGVLHWKPNYHGKRRGKAGYIANGRWHIKYKQVKYRRARLVFLMHHGYMPDMVDHIDRDPSNDRIENLRAATPGQNRANNKRSDKKYQGVYTTNTTVWAQYSGEMLGYYKTEREAAYRYDIAAQAVHGKYAYRNFPYGVG